MLNENIKNLRKAKGLSQEELGKLLHISKQTISKWESNLSSPDIQSCKAMADVFGADRPVGFAREITKTFETIRKMTLGELVKFIESDHNQQKGEIVLVVGGATQEKDMEQEKLDQLLTRLLQDLSVKAASQLAADLTGIKKKVAYQRALELTAK